MTKKLRTEQFVWRLGKLIERVELPLSVNTELELEFAVLPKIKEFIAKEFSATNSVKPVLYHHGITPKEKYWWSRSKLLQTVNLFGSNVSDMFISHPQINAVAIEFKYAKDPKLTSQIQRAIGQSMIATVRHPFAICAIIYRKHKKFPPEGKLKALRHILWKKHHIFFLIRPQ